MRRSSILSTLFIFPKPSNVRFEYCERQHYCIPALEIRTVFHLLQGLASRLSDEQKDVDHDRPVEDTEHQERPPAHVIHGMRCRLREHKVEQPLRSCSNGDTNLSDARWEDLAHVKPWDGALVELLACCAGGPV